MMDSEDGHLFIKNLAEFVKKHERAIANALQLQRQSPRRGHASYSASSPTLPTTTSPISSSSSTSSTIAAALSLPYLSFTSATSQKPVKLTLTPHHLFYLLSRFEELNVPVGPMNVRLEDLHAESSPAEYVSFLSQTTGGRRFRSSDRDSIHSVSSLRSVMSGMSSFWSSFGLSSKISAAKTEKQRAAIKEDLRYLYSAFTKIPCLKLSPDHLAPRIRDWEIFPFDTAVPLFAFKNLSALEVCDVDFRQFYGWDRLADQLRSLTVKRASLDDPLELLVHIVIDDMDKRRRKATKPPGSPGVPTVSPRVKHRELAGSSTDAEPSSLSASNPRLSADELSRMHDAAHGSPLRRPSLRPRPRSASPERPKSHRTSSHPMSNSVSQLRRSSGSSGASLKSQANDPRNSTHSLLSQGMLPSHKWRFLKHLSIADNALTTLSATSFAPVANTLQSLDISSNLFTEIPDALATLVALRALNLSNCMIDSLHSLRKSPLPAVTALNLRHNRLASLAGIERLLPLERVDFRDNRLTDPTELARLTGLPEIKDIFVNRNPFTKTHSHYRVTIVNLFRQTPGYTEDVMLDASTLSSNERKMLVDRVPEPVAVPIIKPPLEEEDPISKLPTVKLLPGYVVLEPTQTDGAADQPQPVLAPGECAAASQRKRKGARRRMVELSKETEDDASSFTEPPSLAVQAPEIPLPEYQTSSDPVPPALSATEVQLMPEVPQLSADAHHLPDKPALAQTIILHTEEEPKIAPIPIRTMSDFTSGVCGEAYKQKIEALRSDLGSAWLSALTEERWDHLPASQHHQQPSMGGVGVGGALHDRVDSVEPLLPPALPVRAHSQGIVSVGRTLG